jgi:hypothetical protein
MRDLMDEPFGSDDEPREVTIPIPTQPMPLPIVEPADPMARPFAASTAPIPVDMAEPAAPAPRLAQVASEPRLSRLTVLALVGGVALLGLVAAGVLYRYAAPGATGAGLAADSAASRPTPLPATALTPTRAETAFVVPAAPAAPPRGTPPAANAITPAPAPPARALAAPAPDATPTSNPIPAAGPTLPTLAAPAPTAAPSANPTPTPASKPATADSSLRPAGIAEVTATEAGRPIPIDRPPTSVAQRRSVCGDLLQEATLRRLSAEEAAYFKKECR